MTKLLRSTPLLLLLIAGGSLRGQEIAPTDSSVVEDSVATAAIPYVNPTIPLVGSIDRTLNDGQIITDSALHFYDYRSLYDIVQTIPGVFIRDLGTPGQFNGLTINGIEGNGIAFFADGVLLNDPMTGAYDLNLYPVSNIERIEVVRGPKAFMYGLNSTGAAINFVTKSKRALHPYSRIRYSESSHDYGYFDGMVSQDVVRRVNVTAGAGHVTSAGRFTNSDYDAWNGRVKLRYDANERLNVYGSFMYNKMQAGLNGGVDLTKTPNEEDRFDGLQAVVVNSDAYEKNSRYDFTLGTTARLFEDTTSISTLTLFHSWNLREYRDEENRAGSNGYVQSQDDLTEWYGARTDHNFSLSDVSLRVAAELQSRNVVAGDLVDQLRRLKYSFSAIGSTMLLRTMGTSAFVRWDKEEKDVWSFSFGCEVSTRLTSWLESHIGAAESFGRYHYWFEVHREYISPRQYGFSWNFPPNVNRELFRQVELGVQMAFDSESALNITYRYRSISDTRGFDFSHVASVIQGAFFQRKNRRVIQGVSLTHRTRLSILEIEALMEFMTMTYNGERENLWPKWKGSISLFYRDLIIDDHLDLKTGFSMRGQSSSFPIEYDPIWQTYRPKLSLVTEETAGAATVDFLLIAHIGSAYVHFVWENLLDKKYVTTWYYPMPERNIRFGVTWEFEN